MKMRQVLTTMAMFVVGMFMPAFADQASLTGAITGVGDPGAQIVVTQMDGGKVIGTMVKCDGSYRVDALEPGRYQIVEGGPHHAPRTIAVKAGEDSHVDLAPQSSIKGTCH